jgi:hypothetical protein
MRNQSGSILKGLLIYFVVAFSILYAVVHITHKIISPVESSAKSFFKAISDKRYDEAYILLSERLKSTTPKHEFHTFIKEYKLYKSEKTTWHTEKIEGKRAKLLGNILLKSGFSMNVEIYLVLEQGNQGDVFGEIIDLSDIPLVKTMEVWKLDWINILQKP